MASDSSIKLDQIEINPLEYTLQIGDEKLALQPKFIEVLCFLAHKHPELVTRTQIIDEVWDGNYYVGEKALTNAIWHLRKGLKQLNPEQEYIETIRKSGYRLLIAPSVIDKKGPINELMHTRQTSFFVIMLVVVLSVFSAINMWPQRSEAVYQKPQLVTQYPGRELFPSVSHDGRYIAYSWRQMDRQTNLFIKDLKQPDLAHTNFTFTKGSESRSRWAPDGNTIFFYRRSQAGCQVIGKSLIDASEQIHGQCAKRGSSDVDVSNDGMLLAYVGVDKSNVNRGIYIKKLDGKTQQIAVRQPCSIECLDADAESLAFSGDGRRLAFSRNRANGHEDIYLYDIATQAEQKLVSGYLDIRGLDWHPKSDKLVFAAITNGIRDGYEVDINSKAITRLNISGFSYPAYGEKDTLFYHNWNIDTAIMRLELGNDVASSPFPLLQSEFNFSHPDFSALRQQLAFISNESGYDEVWLSSLDGVTRKRLTKLKQNASKPSWSKDGNKIAFTTLNDGDNQLYVVDVETGHLTHLETSLMYHSKANWSADNESLFVSDGSDIYRVYLDPNKEVTKIAAGRFAMEGDAGLLFINQGNQGIWRLNLASEQVPVQIFDANLASASGWQYSEKGIYYFNVRGHDYRLSYYEFATGQHHDLLRVPERSFSRSRGMTYSAKHDWLLFTGYETPQVDIKRIEKQ